MINELSILIWFGAILILIVPLMKLLAYRKVRITGFAYGMKQNLPENLSFDRPLSESRQQTIPFRAIFESAPECVSLQNEDGIIEQINNTGKKLLGIRPSSNMAGLSIYSLIAEEYHQAHRAFVASVFNGDEVSMDYEIVTPMAERRWIHANAAPLRNSQGKITHLIAVSHDVTDERLISQQNETHRVKLQTIIESEPECVKLQDAFGKIIEMNPAGLSLLNAEKYDDVIGKKIYDFLMPEYTDEYRELTSNVFKGIRGSMEFEVVSLKGKRRWLETHAAPLFDNNGKVSALLAITRDIDERKNNEARLHQQQTELARVCRLSTMGEMASSLAHELNQPLCAVSSYAESARMHNLPANTELDDLLVKIVKQSRRATQIIQNMRDFVRKQSPRPESISAISIINSVIEFVEMDRSRSMINFSLQYTDDLLPVKADRVQIEQVLLNLISNAMHATQRLAEDKRTITIKVSCESSEENTFEVCNSGPDISDEVAKQLFTPFYTTRTTGMGMGLSISRSIVEAHGGRIWYKAKPGLGTSFSFTLPVADNA